MQKFIDWLVDWFFGWLADWMIYVVIDWYVHWFILSLFDLNIDWRHWLQASFKVFTVRRYLIDEADWKADWNEEADWNRKCCHVGNFSPFHTNELIFVWSWNSVFSRVLWICDDGKYTEERKGMTKCKWYLSVMFLYWLSLEVCAFHFAAVNSAPTAESSR